MPRRGARRSIWGWRRSGWACRPRACRIEDGTIVGPGNLRTSYWELADDALLARDASPGIAAKAPAARRVAGTPVARLDLPDKVFGRPRFVHDLGLPGLLHGRVLKPAVAGREADLAGGGRRARRCRRDRRGARRQLCRRRRRDGDGGGGGPRSPAQGRGMERGIRAARRERRSPPGSRASPPTARPSTSARRRRAAQGGAHHPRGSTTRPFIAHASMAPSCAIAQWPSAASVHVWSHCQGVYNLRADLAIACALPPESIVVAARRGRRLLRPQRRRRRGASMRCCWRAPPAGVRCACNGRARTSWPGRRWARPWPSTSRPTSTPAATSCAGATRCGATAMSARSGRAPIPDGVCRLAARQAVRALHLPSTRRWPMAAGQSAMPFRSTSSRPSTSAITALLNMPIRTSALRTLGAFANVFAIESFMDELAAERGEDPLAFRLRHLKDPRARAVLEAAAARAGWSHADQARGRRPRHRLRPLQEFRRLLRRGGGGGGRGRHPRAPAGGRRSTSAR